MKKQVSFFLLSLLFIILILPVFAVANSVPSEFNEGTQASFILLIIVALATPYLLSIAGETLFAKWYLKVQGLKAVLVANVFTTLVVTAISPFAIYFPGFCFIVLAVIMLIEFFIYWMTYRKEVPFRKIAIYTLLANLISASIFFVCMMIYYMIGYALS